MKSFILACSILLSLGSYAQSVKEIIYTGTYSIRGSKGIYVFELNRNTGNLKLIQTVSDLESPTYIEVHPSGKFLFAVNRGPITKGDGFGSVTSYSIQPKSGKLTFINHISSYGKDPCHISFDKKGDWAFISNYGEGNVVVFPVFEDGSIGAPTDSKKYFGKSVNRFRQEQPHIHSAEVSADNRFVYISDLGTDKIYTYSFDTPNGRIIPATNPEVTVTAGAGPRHFTFHPNGNFAYSAQELSSTVGVSAVDKSNGGLKLLRDTLTSLPKDAKEVNTIADIHTDPAGKYYVSNRGFDGITIYKIKPDGHLELKAHEKSRGKTPRNFLVDSKGKYIWVANQNSDNIAVFKVHPKTGMLTFTNTLISVPSPVCLKQLTLK